MEQSESIKEKLQAPFLPEEIEWRVGSTTRDKSKGLALAYVTNRAIQNRLDDVFGIFGWKNEFAEWKDKSQICGISVWDAEKKGWITKYDGADDSNMAATKGGLSDAMKRAAYQWGIGRYLYKLPAIWVPLKQVGNSYALAETPKLPEWALPKGYKPANNKTTKQTQPISINAITLKQQQRMFALSKGNQDIVKKVIKNHGYEHTKDILKDEYESICNEIEIAAEDAMFEGTPFEKGDR